MADRCLFCYRPLSGGEKEFHPSCSRKMFGTEVPPELPYDENEMESLGLHIVRSSMTVTGVQPKLSLELPRVKKKNVPVRFTIVGLWGEYILKPPSDHYPFMPEIENLTMHLADIAGISTVPHSLIRLRSGTRAYITRRVDRAGTAKLAMEDMCQLTGRLTEHKYDGSYEQIAKAIVRYSASPLLDVVNFYEIVLFSFLTGNADMHLKNFSLLSRPGIGPVLAPAYDLLSTVLVNSADTEEMALTLNGKKRNVRRNDFIAAFEAAGLNARQQNNILRKFEPFIQAWIDFINGSDVLDEYKKGLEHIVRSRRERL